MKLSKRLLTAAEMVPQNDRVIDVASDHGWLGLWLLKQNKIQQLLLTDINSKALANARKNAVTLNLNPDFIVTDGLNNIEVDQYDTIIISGLGAKTIVKILTNQSFNNNQTIILIPHTAPELVRKYMYKRGFKILAEKIVYENGLYYFISKYQLGHVHYKKSELLFSPYYFTFDRDLYKKYLQNCWQKNQKLIKQLPFKKLKLKSNYFYQQLLIKKMLLKIK